MDCHKTRTIYILICVATFLLYAKSLFFGWTYLDDNVLILQSTDFLRNILNIFPAFFAEVFHGSNGSAAYFRPLLTISFMPEAILAGTWSFIYHFFNIAIHVLATCLLYKLLRKLNCEPHLSAGLAFVFLALPCLVQAVAWVPGRNDSLLAVFLLASFIFFTKYLEEQNIKNKVWALAFFMCALFTKENAVFFLPMLACYTWIKKYSLKKLFINFSGPLFLGFLAWFAMRAIALQNPAKYGIKTAFISLYQNFPAVLQMLGKVFFPFNLSVLPVMPDTVFYWGWISLGILILLFIFGRQKQMMLFGIIWFLAFLLPAFIRPDPSIIADFLEHRLYVPVIGLTIFFSQINIKKFGYIFIAGIFCVFSTITFLHQDNFKNQMAFWKNASENSPHSALAQRNLGAMYYLDKQPEQAKIYYEKALAINQQEPMAHNNLGLIYADQGQYEKALEEYQKELSFNPYYADAHYNLGLLYYKIGKNKEAEKEFQIASALKSKQ